MILDIKIKTIGKPEYRDTKIQLPDECEKIIEGFKIELIEHHEGNLLTIHFIKDEIDFYSHSIYNSKDQYNFLEGFKYAFRKLNQLREENDD